MSGPDLYGIANALHTRIDDTKRTLGIQDVWFGDQRLIPRVPAVCVDPISAISKLTDTGFQSVDEVRIWLFIYHGKVQDVQANRRECMQFAQAVRDFVNVDKKNSNTVLIGYVDGMELGTSVKNQGELMIATRLGWRAILKSSMS